MPLLDSSSGRQNLFLRFQPKTYHLNYWVKLFGGVIADSDCNELTHCLCGAAAGSAIANPRSMGDRNVYKGVIAGVFQGVLHRRCRRVANVGNYRRNLERFSISSAAKRAIDKRKSALRFVLFLRLPFNIAVWRRFNRNLAFDTLYSQLLTETS